MPTSIFSITLESTEDGLIERKLQIYTPRDALAILGCAMTMMKSICEKLESSGMPQELIEACMMYYAKAVDKHDQENPSQNFAGMPQEHIDAIKAALRAAGYNEKKKSEQFEVKIE